MMSYGGINIFPAEIERVLDAHPAVRESAAFPVAAGELGQLPMAAVELTGRRPSSPPSSSPGRASGWARALRAGSPCSTRCRASGRQGREARTRELDPFAPS